MNSVSQRVVKLCVGLVLLGISRQGWAADRPPASDDPWPVAEQAAYLPAITRSAVSREAVPTATPNRVPANPVMAKNRGVAAAAPASRNSTPTKAAQPDNRTARTVRPVGTGVSQASDFQTLQARPRAKVQRTAGFVPLHEHTEQILGQGPSYDEVFEDVPGEILSDESGGGDPYYVPETHDGMFFDDEEHACGNCGDCFDCCLLPCPTWGCLQAWAGTVAFTGPVNLGGTGSFGFQEGVNYGSRLPWGILPEVGWQAGVRFTQTNLSGSELTDTKRLQTFFTGGLFRRVHHGLQMGVVMDLLHDEWYGEADLTQIRGELGWIYEGRTEYGIWWAAEGRNKQPVNNIPLTTAVNTAINTVWQPTDIYAAYARRYFGTCNFGQARAYIGATSTKDGILGADALLPMTDRWSFQAGFTYLIPEQSAGAGTNSGHAQESWNLALSVVWVPGRPAHNRYRPLFSVADNGCFLVDRQ